MSWYFSKPTKDIILDQIFICDCGDQDHSFALWGEKGSGEVSLSTHLSTHRGFLKRLILGVKYIFGFPTSKYGEYDNIILHYSDIEPLRDSLNKWLESYK